MSLISVDGKRKRIYENSLGKKFYLINNPYSSNGSFSLVKMSEAIKTIRRYLGDQIMFTKNGGIVVVKYINRDFGEEVNKFSIENYKKYNIDELKYCLCLEGSWGSKNYLTKNGGIAIKIEDVGVYSSFKEAQNSRRRLQEIQAKVFEWYGIL